MKINKLNEEIKQYKLDNGLTVYLYDNPEFTNLYANYTNNNNKNNSNKKTLKI